MAAAVKRRMLVMENGSVHEGTGFGSMNDAVMRAGVQHFHGRLSGNRDRSQLHRADGGDDLSAHRQLRHHRRGQ